MKVAQITVFGGAGQIGGNKILLQDSGTDLWFDFGLNFEQSGRYFAEFLKPRDSNSGLYDYLMMDLLPPIEGLYRKDASVNPIHKVAWQSSVGRWGQTRSMTDGVLLSHAHIDHTGYIGFLNPNIPIISSAMTAVIAKAIQDTGQSTLSSEIAYYSERHQVDDLPTRLHDTGINLKLPRLKKPGHSAKNIVLARPWLITDYDNWTNAADEFWQSSPNPKLPISGPSVQPFNGPMGKLTVRPFPVDHSIEGAHAYAVKTSAGWVVYTGDIRMHGRRGHQTIAFAEAVRDLNPIALICEGTRVSPNLSVSSTEQIVSEKSQQAVNQSDGLVVADFGPRNVERLVSFLDIANKTGRDLVVLSKDAYLLEAMSKVDNSIPTAANHTRIKIYLDRSSQMKVWEQSLIAQNKNELVRWQEVSDHPEKYIICLSLYDLPRLLDINPQRGTYILSTTEPFNVEMEMDFARLNNWIKRFNLSLIGDPDKKTDPRHTGFHTGGHATGEEIFKFIETVNPQMLVPVHTEHPNLMAEYADSLGIHCEIPKLGRTIKAKSIT